jgi:hypothetical protein
MNNETSPHEQHLNRELRNEYKAIVCLNTREH